MNEWKKYPPNKIFCPHADCFYQKKIKDDICMEIMEYTVNDRISYEAEFRIEKENITVSIKMFSYPKLDFEKIESDALQIINKLI